MTAKQVNPDYICIHEKRIGKTENRITELEARADFKDEKIIQVIDDQRRMEEKIDHIAEAVNQLQLQSLRDDKDIDKRVTSLENTVQVLKWIITLLFGSGIIWIIITHIN